MRHTLHRNLLMATLIAGLAFFLAPVRTDAYQPAPWLDQITEYVVTQKAITNEGTFQPYFDQLKLLRTATSKSDWTGTHNAMDTLMGMLEHRAGGIPQETADAIWNYCYRVTPEYLHTEHEQIKAMGKEAYEKQRAWEQDMYDRAGRSF